MTLIFYPDSSDWVGRIRLGSGFQLVEAAESGTFAMSQVQVDDPASELDIVGHHSFRTIETACSWRTLFRGYFADRTVRRGADPTSSLRTGVARVWDCTVIDANAVLQFEVIRGSTGKRPAETDTQRLAWLLGSSHKGPIGSSDANVLGYDVDLDKADYRGLTMADVLADCASASGANFFAAWDEDHDEYRLHYYRPTRSFFSSSLAISNVLSDVDGDTVFAPSADARMMRDPSRVYSGVYYRYGERESAVFEESATVLAAIGHRREVAEGDGSVRTAARATAKAQRYLSEAETDLDKVSVTLRKVPPNRVNLIRAGHRVQVRFSHLPGLTSWTWLRVTRRTVAQDGEDQLHYRIDLELADPKQVGARNRRPAVPVEPDVEDGSSVSLSRYALHATFGELDQVSRAETFAFDGPGGPISTLVADGINYFTTYIYAGCPFGESGWSGTEVYEQWVTFDPGDMDADGVIAIRFDYSIGTPEGIAGDRDLSIGIGTGAYPPTAHGQAEDFARAPVASGSFVVPRSQLVPSSTNAVVIAPGWEAMRGVQVCSGELTNSPNPGPTRGGGEFNSGRVSISGITATKVTMDGGTGLIPWRTPSGAIDGSNRTFSLQDWNGKGAPSVRIGAVSLKVGEDFTYDSDAGTVTLTIPPWPGADLAGRWLV